MLSSWSACKHYILVDPWAAVVDDDVVGMERRPDAANTRLQAEQDANLDATRHTLHPFGSKVAFLRMTSLEAAASMLDESVDIVYIDGMHLYYDVLRDLCAWYPKVRPGGMLAGHDYFLGYSHGTVFTVQPAVDAFVRALGLLLLTTHDQVLPSWYFFKPPVSASASTSASDQHVHDDHDDDDDDDDHHVQRQQLRRVCERLLNSPATDESGIAA